MKKFLKIFLVFCFAIFLQTSVCAKNIGVTVITDSHLSSDKQNNTMTPTVGKLIKAVEQANLDTSSFVVFLGDNASGANRVDVAMFSKIIKRLKKPYFVLAGNRDINKAKGMTKKEFYRIVNKFSSNKISSLPYAKKCDDLVFIFLSGVNETFPSYKGYYKLNEIEYLDKTLTKYKNKKIVIFQHFPVIPPAYDDTRETFKKEIYLDTLKKHDNVIAVISGHYHIERINDENGIKHISVPALYQYGEYEQIKFFQNKDGSYSITTRIFDVN